MQDCYDKLCPPELHQPYKRVIDELTEAFIQKSPGIFAERVDWIHPSCRDLAIDELSENPHERERFLSSCSETGLALATSFAGGAKGLRELPLLQTDEDWGIFRSRTEQVLKGKAEILNVLWQNYLVAKEKADKEPSLVEPVSRLADIIEKGLSLARKDLVQTAYSNLEFLNRFFEICNALGASPNIDLCPLWTDCIDDVDYWVEHPDAIWDDNAVPERVTKFLKILNSFAPTFLQDPKVHEQLQKMLDTILDRATTDDNSIYDSPQDDDEIGRRAQGFDELHKSFGDLADIPLWGEDQQKSLQQCATHFWAEAASLREGLPWEPDYDDSGTSRPPSAEVNLSELFRDL